MKVFCISGRLVSLLAYVNEWMNEWKITWLYESSHWTISGYQISKHQIVKQKNPVIAVINLFWPQSLMLWCAQGVKVLWICWAFSTIQNTLFRICFLPIEAEVDLTYYCHYFRQGWEVKAFGLILYLKNKHRIPTAPSRQREWELTMNSILLVKQEVIKLAWISLICGSVDREGHWMTQDQQKARSYPG
jgi:hypothetical protein